MNDQMQRCENCYEMIPSLKISTHFGYCRRNIKKCERCFKMYDINFMEQHEEQFHKKSKCQYCSKQFSKTEQQQHEQNCSRKTKMCQYCQQSIPLSGMNAHVRACESRTRPCEKCHKNIVNSNYFVHLSTCNGPQQIEQPVSYNDFIRKEWTKHYNQEQKYPSSNRPQPIHNKHKNNTNNTKIQVATNTKNIITRNPNNIYKSQPQNNNPQTIGKQIKSQSLSQSIKSVPIHPEIYSYHNHNQSPGGFHSQHYYYQRYNNYSPNHHYESSHHNESNHHSNYLEKNQEDPEFQKAIMMSMGIQQNKDIPAEFKDMNMDQSFVRDLKYQDAYEDLRKNYHKK